MQDQVYNDAQILGLFKTIYTEEKKLFIKVKLDQNLSIEKIFINGHDTDMNIARDDNWNKNLFQIQLFIRKNMMRIRDLINGLIQNGIENTRLEYGTNISQSLFESTLNEGTSSYEGESMLTSSSEGESMLTAIDVVKPELHYQKMLMDIIYKLGIDNKLTNNLVIDLLNRINSIIYKPEIRKSLTKFFQNSVNSPQGAISSISEYKTSLKNYKNEKFNMDQYYDVETFRYYADETIALGNYFIYKYDKKKKKYLVLPNIKVTLVEKDTIAATDIKKWNKLSSDCNKRAKILTTNFLPKKFTRVDVEILNDLHNYIFP